MAPTPVILLKEGADSFQAIPQLVSNSAYQVIAEGVQIMLGPHGMDKLIVYGQSKAKISNNGTTFLKLLDVINPAAQTLVDIAIIPKC